MIIEKSCVSSTSQTKDYIQSRNELMLFKTHFSSFFTMILNDIINFNYVNVILDNESLTNREIRRIIKKTISNKTSNLNDISNKVIRSAMKITNEQIRSLFERCLRDEM